MTTSPEVGLHAIADALADVCRGERDAWNRLPVPIRAGLAAVALAASGRAANGVAVARAGRYSRGTAHRTDSPWKDLLIALTDGSHNLADLLLDDANEAPDAAALAAELAARDHTIAELRRELTEAKNSIRPLADYAHDLAVALRDYRDDEQAALDAKVVDLHRVK